MVSYIGFTLGIRTDRGNQDSNPVIKQSIQTVRLAAQTRDQSIQPQQPGTI